MKASPALGVLDAWLEAEGALPGMPGLLQLSKTTNRPFALSSAAGLSLASPYAFAA